jgi:hypothetical protein
MFLKESIQRHAVLRRSNSWYSWNVQTRSIALAVILIAAGALIALTVPY